MTRIIDSPAKIQTQIATSAQPYKRPKVDLPTRIILGA
jgi:hypothetical protein